MLLQYILIILFLMMPSILWSAPVPPAAKHPHNMMLPSRCFTVGMVFFGVQASPFFLQTKQWSLWPNSSIVVSSDQRTFFQKVWSLSSCAVENRSLYFLWRIWSSGFFLAERPFRLCRYRTRFTVDIDTFVPVSSSIFTRSFAVVLGLICTFRTTIR